MLFSKSGENISMYDATLRRTDQTDQWNWGFNVANDIDSEHKDIFKRRFRVFNRTLVMVEGYHQIWKFIVIKIHVWNLNTLKYVSEINYHDQEKFIGVSSDQFADMESASLNANVLRAEVAFAKDKFAVNILFIIGESYQLQTQIWNFNTTDPSLEHISYMKTIEHDFEADTDHAEVNSIKMNSKLLCIAMHSLTRRKLILNVYSLDDLTHHTSLTVTEEVEFDKAPECLFILESEISTKIAVLDENKNKLKVYKFDGYAHLCFQIDLHRFASKHTSSLSQMIFLLGKLVIILPVGTGGQFQCIIVNEDGDVIEGIKRDLLYGELISGVTVDGVLTYVGETCEEDKESVIRHLLMYN